jgi:hypothetical protein
VKRINAGSNLTGNDQESESMAEQQPGLAVRAGVGKALDGI